MNNTFISNIYSDRSRSAATSCFNSAVLLALLFSAFTSTDLSATPEEDTRKAMEAAREGDTFSAMRHYRRAAEQGYAPAQVELARILDRSELNEEAQKWYQKAAEQNNPEGQYGLGIMYLSGDGMEPDTELGLQLVNQAADQGLFSAMKSMFHFTKDGQHGLTADPATALSWLEKIAETDNRWAIETLASAHRNGELGLSPSEENAQLWEMKLRSRPATQK